MPTASLVYFHLPAKGRTKGELNRFYREFYGYENYSYYGRYRSRIQGFLDRVRNIRYAKSLFMVRIEDERQVTHFLREKGAQVRVWKVTPQAREWKSLQSRSG